MAGGRRAGMLLRSAVLLLCLLVPAAHTKQLAAAGKKTAEEVSAIENFQKEVDADTAAAAAITEPVRASRNALKVCIMTADFWGLKSAGGTATAYHLLAAVLAKDPSLHVTFLGVSKKFTICQEAKQINTKANMNFECLEPHHFVPEIVETYPYEQLSHAVLFWVMENLEKCDVIHGHEWGGAFIDLITAINLRQLKPGLRMAVEPHGGHFWSSQGQVQRPMDVISLRIDNQERMANQLNDYLISPTNYMTAFLRQRGWVLPESTVTIPNIIPEVEESTAQLMGQEKPIWRLAFFSRLEERKGIKLFVESISRLNDTNVDRFEVYFVGSDAKIDMRPSSTWLVEKTAKWPFKTHMKVGVKRDEALDILSQEGVLLVLCSLIDNMPYVVAEAAVKGIPFLVFDAGGVLEMFDAKQHKDNVVPEPTLTSLAEKLTSVLSKGKIKSVKLADRIMNGRDQWLDWHKNYTVALPGLIKEDEAIATEVQRLIKSHEPSVINIIKIGKPQHALELWESVCDINQDLSAQPPLLLLPQEYEWLDREAGSVEMATLIYYNKLIKSSVGALTFGAQLPTGKVSFPTSPSWMIYAGDDSKCLDNIPILILPEVFCSSFLAEARVFRSYQSWVLIMLLTQQARQMHVYPKVMFSVKDYDTNGYSCMADKIPVARQLSFPVASNLYKDSEELLRNLHLAPYLKPIVSLIDDFPTHQKHKGWQFGYLSNDTSRHINWLEWKEADTGLVRDGKWACGVTEHSYPSMHHSLLHPCAGPGKACCGNVPNAPFLLRYESFFHSRGALLVLAYEVWPICGDGLDFIVRLTPSPAEAQGRKPQILLKRSYEADSHGSPNRQKIEWKLHLRTGDIIDFLVNPRQNHDCDGLYIVDVQIWVDDHLKGFA